MCEIAAGFGDERGEGCSWSHHTCAIVTAMGAEVRDADQTEDRRWRESEVE